MGENADKCEHEFRPYLASLPADAEHLGNALRSHWGTDMAFRDDDYLANLVTKK